MWFRDSNNGPHFTQDKRKSNLAWGHPTSSQRAVLSPGWFLAPEQQLKTPTPSRLRYPHPAQVYINLWLPSTQSPRCASAWILSHCPDWGMWKAWPNFLGKKKKRVRRTKITPISKLWNQLGLGRKKREDVNLKLKTDWGLFNPPACDPLTAPSLIHLYIRGI